VLLKVDGDERVFVRSAKTKGGVLNKGVIDANIAELKAHDGNVYGMAIKNEGRVTAKTLTKEGGKIYLRSGRGKISNSGRLEAKGGKVRIDAGPTGEAEVAGTMNIGVGAAAGAGKVAITAATQTPAAGATINVLNNATLYVFSSFTIPSAITLIGGDLTLSNALALQNSTQLVLSTSCPLTLAADVALNGILSIQNGVISGSGGTRNLNVSGNVINLDTSFTMNSSVVRLVGNTHQILSGGGMLTNLNIAKTGGVVLLANDFNLGNGSLTGAASVVSLQDIVQNGRMHLHECCLRSHGRWPEVRQPLRRLPHEQHLVLHRRQRNLHPVSRLVFLRPLRLRVSLKRVGVIL
jgi:hypothetical protein